MAAYEILVIIGLEITLYVVILANLGVMASSDMNRASQ
jgi:hypothetical protein